MVNDIREQEVKQYGRQKVFEEPGCFFCEYEEINYKPFFHFTFLTKPSLSLIKMLRILQKEAEDILWLNGHDYVYSYTKSKNKAVIRIANLLGFSKVKEVDKYTVLRKEIKNG